MFPDCADRAEVGHTGPCTSYIHVRNYQVETKSLYQFLFFNEQQILFGETALSLGLVANQLILKSH